MRMNLNNVTFTKLLILSAAVYISWSGVCCDWLRGLQKSLRLRMGGNHGSSEASFLRHHHHRFNASEPTGIYFSRSISSWSPDSPLQVQFDSKHCKETDVYGENNCHFDWGDQVDVNYSIYVNQTLDESAYLEGTFKVKSRIEECQFQSLVAVFLTHTLFVHRSPMKLQVGKVPWRFTCSMCGEDCEMKIPVIDFDFSFPMPPCPILCGKIHLRKDGSPYPWKGK
jgi:hypothetical protein